VFRNGEHFIATLPAIFLFYLVEAATSSGVDEASRILGIFILIVGLFVWATFAIAWRRLIMISEQVSFLNPFKIVTRECSFIWRGILLGIITLTFCLSILVIVVFITVDMSLAPVTRYVVIITALLLPLILWNRHTLILPAVAIDLQWFGLKDSWRSTRAYGHSFL
jgi:hypothetical protein